MIGFIIYRIRKKEMTRDIDLLEIQRIGEYQPYEADMKTLVLELKSQNQMLMEENRLKEEESRLLRDQTNAAMLATNAFIQKMSDFGEDEVGFFESLIKNTFMLALYGCIIAYIYGYFMYSPDPRVSFPKIYNSISSIDWSSNTDILTTKAMEYNEKN
ncbi:hypothetical protein N9043_00380 [bacterium]|nr:hypothetical protein [bacterium]